MRIFFVLLELHSAIFLGNGSLIEWKKSNRPRIKFKIHSKNGTRKLLKTLSLKEIMLHKPNLSKNGIQSFLSDFAINEPMKQQLLETKFCDSENEIEV